MLSEANKNTGVALLHENQMLVLKSENFCADNNSLRLW